MHVSMSLNLFECGRVISFTFCRPGSGMVVQPLCSVYRWSCDIFNFVVRFRDGNVRTCPEGEKKSKILTPVFDGCYSITLILYVLCCNPIYSGRPSTPLGICGRISRGLVGGMPTQDFFLFSFFFQYSTFLLTCLFFFFNRERGSTVPLLRRP